MRISYARVFGFGKWVDYDLEFPKHGPVIIFGENESGKSTFYQFILFMLFGMQPKDRKFYQPKTSSKLGGQLIIEDKEVGSFTIERFDDKNNGKATCLLPTGEVYDEAWLQGRLQGMDKKTFQSIFSFTAIDLNAIKEMREEELGDVLLSIGLTGSNSIYQMEKELDHRLGNLFKPYGKKPEMNKQLQVVQQLADELAEIKAEEATYYDKTTTSDKLQQKITDLQKEQSLLDGKSHWIGKKRTALPLLEAYQELKEKHEQVREELPFPVDGIARLENIKDALRPLQSEYAVLESNESAYRNSVDEIKQEQLPQETFNELLEKQEMHEVYKKGAKEIGEINGKKQSLSKNIKKELNELQIDCSEEDLDELSLPFYIEETWKQLKEDQERLEQEQVNLEIEKNALVEEQSYLKKQLQIEHEASLSEEEIDVIEEKIRKGKESEQLEHLYQTTRQQQLNYEENRKIKFKRSKLYLWIGTTLSILGIVVANVGDQAFLSIFSGILFILSLGQFIFTKKNGQEIEKLLHVSFDSERQGNLSPGEMSRLKKQLGEDEERQAEIRALQSDLNRQHISMLQWEEKKRSLQEKNRRLNEQVEEQYILYPFLRDINQTYWPEYYNRLKTLLQMHEEKKEHIAKQNELKMQCERMGADIISFVTELKKETIEEIHACFPFINKLVEKETHLKERKLHLEELIEATQDKRIEMMKRVAVHEKEMTELFQLANVETEEAFYEINAYLTEKEQIEEALTKTERQLNTIFQEGEWEKLFPVTIREEELKSQTQELEQIQLKNYQEIEEMRSKYAEVNAELNRLEGSEVYSKKMHQFEMEKEKLNNLAEEWSILKIEKEVLAETKQRYQEKYLSKVLQETTELLHLITGGKYETIYSPEDKQPFHIVSSKGLRYSVEELSQGTMNQLYVSLRLAISKVMTEKHHVPFLVDDAFVHFDEVRVRRMMKVLAGLADKQQVIMFTCKSDVKEASHHLDIPVISV